MKKLMLLLFPFLLILLFLPNNIFALPVIDQTGNLLINGNFEDGTTSWVTTGAGSQSAFAGFLQWTGSGQTATQLVTDPLIEGDYTGHILGTSPNGVLFVDGIYQYAMRPAGNYTVSTWIYVESGAAYMALAWNAGFSYTDYSLDPKTTSTGIWEYLELTAFLTNSLGGPCVYANAYDSDFYVEGLWLNSGTTSTSPFDPSTGFNPNIVPTPVPFDIKPGSCPNPLNVNSKRVLSVAILGTQNFDVTEIDIASVRLEGVAPLRSSIEDEATPYEPYNGKKYSNDCNDYGSDGFDDLVLKLDTQEIVQVLGNVNDGDAVTLVLTGKLDDGTPIQGEDVVVIKKKGKK